MSLISLVASIDDPETLGAALVDAWTGYILAGGRAPEPAAWCLLSGAERRAAALAGERVAATGALLLAEALANPADLASRLGPRQERLDALVRASAEKAARA